MYLKGRKSTPPSVINVMRRVKSEGIQPKTRRASSASTGGANASWDVPTDAAPQNKSSLVLMNDVGISRSTVEKPLPENGSSNKPTKKHRSKQRGAKIYDDPLIVEGYASVPIIEVDRLPRGGISIETKAVGRIQFGIPPETIKDSMRLGLGVPSVYIVPVERFCREIGPALGLNLAEFEFPAYFNYFVRQKRCTLVVDSLDAEQNIRTVFGETLLGPAQFRNHELKTPNEDEDFDPSFPKEARPNFYKEFLHFRTAEESSNFKELTIDMLLDFCRFEESQHGLGADVFDDRRLGVPPMPEGYSSEEDLDETDECRRHSVMPEAALAGSKRGKGSVKFRVEAQKSTSIHPEGTNENGRVPILRSLSDSELPEENGNSQPSPVQAAPDVTFALDADDINYPKQRALRRGSMESTTSVLSKGTRSRGGMSWSTGASFMLSEDDEDDTRKPWIYSQAKWLGDVATVYPHSASDEQKQNVSTPRVEIFKMMGGTEYIVHDIDENNVIIGKARFSGSVRVPDEMAVEGFLGTEDVEEPLPEDDHSVVMDEGGDTIDAGGLDVDLRRPAVIPPTFHPPSFGVTVLGNSHGFDKNGSTSGYVLWINGRGVMIDPPPYSSATLEREGIRPQMIVAIIITHIHADHDAGAFQKVMTGSRVAIITTPTIYKSFIRKYAALSGLSPTLLRHSHRHRPAIIGQPLKFQGATFHFTYTLHTIPCIGFRVEWRGRSMVFTGDHLNSPPVIDALEQSDVLAKERADDLRSLPLQKCDALLHEAGAPPIHTPLAVLKDLPENVKERLYVVHTSALPPDCSLRVAPTGTAGTIRLDEFREENSDLPVNLRRFANGVKSQPKGDTNGAHGYSAKAKSVLGIDPASLDDGGYPNLSVNGGYCVPDRTLVNKETESTKIPPLVFLRPTCVSDAWFILNLLSNVPFLSSLSYAYTMEVLEIAHVEMFCANEVVVPAGRRGDLLCVVWEGTCMEREREQVVESELLSVENDTDEPEPEPLAEQSTLPDEFEMKDFVYVDTVDGPQERLGPTVWHAGDWTGPVALQPDTERSAEKPAGGPVNDIVALSAEGVKVITLNMNDLFKILKKGSKLFRKYLVLKEKQAAEDAIVKAEILRCEMDNSGLTCSGTFNQSIGPEDWSTYDSVMEILKSNSALASLTAHQKRHLESLAEGPRVFEPGECLWEVGQPVDFAFLIVAGTAVYASRGDPERRPSNRRSSSGSNSAKSSGSNVEEDKQLFNVRPDSEYARLEIGLQLRAEEMEMDIYEQNDAVAPKEKRQRNARDRFANKVLARLYARGAYTPGLVFSRGHLLSDTSRMVSGNLSHINTGRQKSKRSISDSPFVDHHLHTSNMAAGPEGCRVMIFPRQSMVQFLDGNPGVLLSLLGTQVVV